MQIVERLRHLTCANSIHTMSHGLCRSDIHLFDRTTRNSKPNEMMKSNKAERNRYTYTQSDTEQNLKRFFPPKFKQPQKNNIFSLNLFNKQATTQRL